MSSSSTLSAMVQVSNTFSEAHRSRASGVLTQYYRTFKLRTRGIAHCLFFSRWIQSYGEHRGGQLSIRLTMVVALDEIVRKS